MLKRILTQKRYLKNIYKEQKGITGLETAIILIAFVVVAAVFAYTVLSAGLFSTQKSQEAVYSGLQETQNTLVVKGGVLSQADPKISDDCGDATDWVAVTNAAISDEAVEVHEGLGSIEVAVEADAADGDTFANATTTVAITSGDTITFWAKLADTALSNKVALGIASSAENLDATNAIVYESIDATDTDWHRYSVDSDGTGTVYYGVFATAASGGAYSFFVDDIQVNNVSLWDSTKSWIPYASTIKLTLSLASTGQPIDFSPGSDTNTNGLFDDAGKTNKMVVNFNDSYQHVTDVTWEGTFIGNNNGDYMLDPGEKIQVAVDLSYINTNAPSAAAKMVANHQFTLELKTPKGAILSLQRTLPARLYGIDNLF